MFNSATYSVFHQAPTRRLEEPTIIRQKKRGSSSLRMHIRQVKQLVTFLSQGKYPKTFPSTKSNFTKKARKFHIGAGNKLYRGGLPVVLQSERKTIFNTYHQHRYYTPSN